MRTNLFRIISLVTASATLSTQAAIFTADFNDGLVPAGTALFSNGTPPGPSVTATGGVGDSGVLRLTEAVGGQQCSFVINDFSGGVAVNGFVARYKARVGGGNGADGYSFCFGSDLPDGSWGEEGIGSGLILAFDTYANAGETANTVDLKYGGVVVASTIYNFTTGNDFADVTITLCPNGRVTVAYGTQTLFDRVQTSYTPTIGRFGFGARTGGAVDNHFIDDLTIDTSDPAALAITSQPTNQTVNQGQTATLSVGVNGFCFNTVQWFSNSVAIPEGTALTYVAPPANLSMNGAVYRAEITDGLGTVISDNATLTVIPAPVVVGASSRRNPNGVFVFFNKNVAAGSALATANYEILSGGITVTGAVFNTVVATNGERSVVLIQTTPAFVGGQTYTVRVSNVQDDDSNVQVPNPIEVSFTHTSGNICYDFNSGLPAGTAIFGNTASTRISSNDGVKNSGALKLTDAARSQTGAFRTDELIAGSAPSKFRVTYMVQAHNPLANNPADGYSFNVAADLPAGTYPVAEEGAGTGLTIGFDNWDATGENAPSIDVKWAGAVLPGGHRVIAKHNYGAYIPIAVEVSSDGTLDLDVNGTNVFRDLRTPYQPINGARLGLAARTGGSVANHWYDDLCISMFNGGPVTFGEALADPSLVEARPFRLDLKVDGSPPYFIQWFSNDVAIPGANSEILSGVATLDMNNANFYAVVSNEFSTATSETATFTVTADSTPPAVVLTRTSRGLNTISLVFSEALDPTTATEVFNITVDGLTIIDRYLTNNGTTIVLITSPQTPETTYNVNMTFIYDASLKNEFTGTVQARAWVMSPGFVQVELYKEIYGTTIANLTGAGKFPNNPDASLYSHIADWRQPQTGNPTRSQEEPWNQYGIRMSGFFIPRVTGSHRFYFTHDDEAQFRMSTDANPAGATVLITPPGVRNLPYADIVNQFIDVTVAAGQPYYFEALMKEGGGGDYLSVGVREPGNNLGTNAITPIQNFSLAALADPSAAPSLTITQQPVGATVQAGHRGTFTVGVSHTGDNLPFYQWYFAGVPVAGANGPTFVTPPAAFDEAVSVDVHLPGVKVSSDSVVMTVAADTAGPQITGSVVLSGNMVSIGFNEAITVDGPGSVTDPANYRVNDAAIVTEVTVVRPDAVKLTVSGTLSGTTTVRAGTAIKDSNGNGVVESGDLPGFSAAFTSVPVTTWTDISNSAGPPLPAGSVFTVNNRDFTVTAGGADVWSGGDQFTYIYAQRAGDFDVRVRVDRLDLAVGGGNLWSKAGLNIRETLDGTAANGSRMVWVYPTPTNGAGQFEAAIRPEPGRDVIDLNGGSYGRWGRGDASAWVRVKRIGKSFTYYNSFDGRNWNPISLPRVADGNPENAIGGQTSGQTGGDAIDFPDTLYVGIGVVSHVQNVLTTAELAEYGDFAYPNASVAVVANPIDSMGYVGGRVKFKVSGLVSGAPQHELMVQWQKNGVDIPGAVSSYVDGYTYTTPPLTMDDNGAQYRARLLVSGAAPVFSAPATLNMLMTNDATTLQLVMARRSPFDANQVILTFNKLVRPSSVVNTANYMIDQGVSVVSAQRQGTRKVVLTTTGLAPLSNCVTYAISVSAVQDGNGVAMAADSDVIPANAAARVLFITGNALFMNMADRIMVDRMDGLGYEVTASSQTAAVRRGAAGANGYSLLFVSSQAGNVGGIGTTFRGVAIPIIVARREIFDDFDFTPNNAFGTVGAHATLNIVDASHPLAGGLSAGIQPLVDLAQVDNRTFHWASNLAASAAIVARINGNPTNTQAAIFGFEAGAPLLNSRTAASRRVGTYLEDNVAQFFNNNARALFDAMLNWVSIPAIIAQPQNVTAQHGGSATLCVVAGTLTAPTYQWYKDGVAVSGATSERLVLNDITDADAGGYRLVVSNASGSTTSAVINVTVPLADLDITRSGENTVLSWTGGGRLQEATTISGPWRDAADQSNPQTLSRPSYGVYLNGAQEPPPVGGGTGTGSGVVQVSGNTLQIHITYSGLSGSFTADHIHGPAGRGANAGVMYGLQGITTTSGGGTAGTISGTITLVEGTGGYTIAQQLGQLQNGLWYVNVHSTTFGGGEIRGQLDAMQYFRVVRP